MASEFNNDSIFRVFDFPWIIVFKPGIWQLCLAAVNDLLPEKTEFITKTNTDSFDADCGHGI